MNKQFFNKIKKHIEEHSILLFWLIIFLYFIFINSVETIGLIYFDKINKTIEPYLFSYLWGSAVAFILYVLKFLILKIASIFDKNMILKDVDRINTNIINTPYFLDFSKRTFVLKEQSHIALSRPILDDCSEYFFSKDRLVFIYGSVFFSWISCIVLVIWMFAFITGLVFYILNIRQRQLTESNIEFNALKNPSLTALEKTKIIEKFIKNFS
jgi:hypothetical protein